MFTKVPVDVARPGAAMIKYVIQHKLSDIRYHFPLPNIPKLETALQIWAEQQKMTISEDGATTPKGVVKLHRKKKSYHNSFMAVFGDFR